MYPQHPQRYADWHKEFSEGLILWIMTLIVLGTAAFGFLAVASWLTTGHALNMPTAVTDAGPSVVFVLFTSLLPYLGSDMDDPEMWVIRGVVLVIQLGCIVTLPVGIMMRLGRF